MKKKNLLLAFPMLFCFSLTSCKTQVKEREYAFFSLSREGYNKFYFKNMIMHPFGRVKDDGSPFYFIYYPSFDGGIYIDAFRDEYTKFHAEPTKFLVDYIDKLTVSIIANEQLLTSRTFTSKELYSGDNLSVSFPFTYSPDLTFCSYWMDLNALFPKDYNGTFILRETKEIFCNSQSKYESPIIDDYEFKFYRNSTIEFLKNYDNFINYSHVYPEIDTYYGYII